MIVHALERGSPWILAMLMALSKDALASLFTSAAKADSSERESVNASENEPASTPV